MIGGNFFVVFVVRVRFWRVFEKEGILVSFRGVGFGEGRVFFCVYIG